MIFLNCMFGYLSILIIAKWASGSTADLYHVLIYMFMSPGNVDCYSGKDPTTGQDIRGCPENKMYAGQGAVQVGGPSSLQYTTGWLKQADGLVSPHSISF